MKEKHLKPTPQDGNIQLVQMQADGRIVQLGITPLQAATLNAFVRQMSKETPIKKMPKEYDLVLKSDCRVLRNRK
ncbi:hypothetical protein [uncultured Chryseobacterium sp.]|uniref:hypothetical protein n=1 Tax=uncultured Chryseobacterium sp. TaxID=259322 RepID=UPI0025FD3CFF|nr:hypothetical protein [uncultured Chryseobacterium sp.]